MHDFVINHIDPDTQTELVLYKAEQVPLCDASSLHEFLHTLMMITPSRYDAQSYHDSLKTPLCIEPKTLIFSTHLHSLFRPPIV